MGNQPSLSIKEYNLNRSRMNCGKEHNDGSKNSKKVEKFLNDYNMRDRKSMQSFVGEGATFSFKGADACLPLEMFMEQIELVQDSFPDVFISWDEIYESEPGVVKVRNFYSRGTHTGKPFGYAHFPAIPATGKVVEEGPSHMVYLVEKGKFTHFEMETPPGEFNGPPGYYTQIGGKIEV